MSGCLCLANGSWNAIHVSMTVLHPGMEELPPLRLEHSGIRAIDVTLEHPEIQQLLATLDSGCLQLPGAAGGAVVPGTDYVVLQEFLRRSYACRDFGIDWPCEEICMQGGGYLCDDLSDRFSRFLAALPTMDPPFSGRRSLERALNVRGEISVSRGGGQVNFRRPYPMRIDRVVSRGGRNEFEILLEAHGDLEPFHVGIIPDSGHRSAGRLGTKDSERTAPSRYSCRRSLPQPGAFSVVLSVRDGLVADELRAGVPSGALLVHQQFDPECDLLETLLFGPSRRGQKDGREFESGVAWLLHLCGFAAMHLGRKDGGKDLQSAPDIVARTPSGELLIGECTLLAPTEQKVEKIRTRSQSTSGMLERVGVATVVRPVLFIGEPCDASFDGVELVDVRRLRDMLACLRSGRTDGLL
jgi:hypothetical protein